MFSPDLTKMFDPQYVTRTLQQAWDFNSALSGSKTSVDSLQKLSTIWTETYGTCTEKQLKLCQAAMEDSVECMKDLSTCKGIEEYMSKQAEWSKKFAEKAQSNAQEIASCVQQGQSQATDLITKLMTQNTEWAKTTMANATTTATNTLNKATGTTTSSK